jgi:hypothetical protein
MSLTRDARGRSLHAVEDGVMSRAEKTEITAEALLPEIVDRKQTAGAGGRS